MGHPSKVLLSLLLTKATKQRIVEIYGREIKICRER